MRLYAYSLFSSFQCFFFKQKTAYEMRMSDWSSDVCSSYLNARMRDITKRRSLNLVLTSSGAVIAAKAKERSKAAHVRYTGPSLSSSSSGGNNRAEERRVGKGGVRRCRSRWSPYNYTKRESR